MGVLTIPAGARGFDALGDPVPLGDAHYWQFRTFYICQGNLTQLSNKITEHNLGTGSTRIARHLEAGMGVLLNYESAGDRWKTGANGGSSDGFWSRDICNRLGYPDGLPVPVSSWDSEIRPRLWDASSRTFYWGPVDQRAIDYGRAFRDGLGDRWTFGPYGGTPIMHALADISALGWQAMASSWSLGGSYPRAVVHVKQRRPTPGEIARYPYVGTPAGWSLDANDALLPFPAWSNVDAPAPPPVLPVPPIPTPTPVTTDSIFLPFGGDVLKAIGIYRVNGEPVLMAKLYDGGYKVAVFGDTALQEVAAAQNLSQLDGRDVSNHVIVDDPIMWRALGPVAGPRPDGFDAYGLPV